MKLFLPALAATLAVFAPAASAWSCGPGGGYGVFVRPSGMSIDSVVSPAAARQVMRQRQRRRQQQQQEMFNQAFTRRTSSPRYEIADSEDAVTISMDLPGVKAEDVNVSLEEDGKVLSVSGQRQKAGEDGSSFSTRFSQQFALDPTIDVEQFSASLKNGVLVVTAPKDLQRIENNIRKIPVMDDANVGAGEQEDSDGADLNISTMTAATEDSQDVPDSPVDQNKPEEVTKEEEEEEDTNTDKTTD